MASSLQLEDFIASYPDVDEKDIKDSISAKKEFVELASGPVETLPRRGMLFKSQQFFVRIMRAYDRILNIAETGTGKSCQLIATAEFFKKHRRHYRGVYVIQKPSTVEDFKRQILCNCAGDEYLTDSIRNASDPSRRKAAFTRELNKQEWYHILTYHEFAKELSKTGDDQAIIDHYSGYIFLIDEAHNLRNDGESSAETLNGIYENIHRAFQLVRRSKIIVSTATPMINEVSELTKMANLILPANRQIPDSFDYNRATFSDIEAYLRGRIFFIRSLDTGITMIDQGEKITGATYQYAFPASDWKFLVDPNQPPPPDDAIQQDASGEIIFKSQVIVFQTLMVGHQNDAYLQLETIQRQKAEYDRRVPSAETDFQSSVSRQIGDDTLFDSPFVTEDLEEKVPPKKGIRGRFYLPERQASCFVYPAWPLDRPTEGPVFGGSFHRGAQGAPTGIDRFIISPAKNQYTLNPDFKRWLVDSKDSEGYYTNLRLCSSKYAEIVKTEEDAFISTGGKPGCAYCYVDFVSGSGAIMLGMCFEACGYERFNESESIFQMVRGEATQGVCSSDSGSRSIKEKFRRKGVKRYALFTGETPQSVQDAILETFNSPENIDGEYIQTVICSPVARDGINIFNVIRGHLITPGWHPSGMYQAMSRFTRAVSHDHLVKRAREEGRGPVIVKIFKYAAVPTEIVMVGNDEYLQPRSDLSIDRMFYQTAESKNIPIRRIMRMLKQLDVGSVINQQRNIREAGGRISIWSLTGQILDEIRGIAGEKIGMNVAMSENQEYLGSGLPEGDGKILLWKRSGHEYRRFLEILGGNNEQLGQSLSFPDAATLVAGSSLGNGSVKIWNQVGESWVDSQTVVEGSGLFPFKPQVYIAPNGWVITSNPEGNGHLSVWDSDGWNRLGAEFVGVNNEHLGTGFALLGTKIAIGSPKFGDGGRVNVWNWDGRRWNLESSILGHQSEGFGAAVLYSENRLIIGSPQFGDGGRVSIWNWNGREWVMATEILGRRSEKFGSSLAISGDHLIVGSPNFGGDLDYSEKCDYNLCRYESDILPDEKNLDYKTYDVYYADEIIETCIHDLVELLKLQSGITYDALYQLWVVSGKYRDKFLYMAIDRLLSEKRRLLDRYGFDCYLHTDGRGIFLKREFQDAESQLELSTYDDQIIGTQYTPFETILAGYYDVEYREFGDLIEHLKSEWDDDLYQQFLDRLDSASIHTNVKILEDALLAATQGEQNQYIEHIITHFQAFIYITEEVPSDVIKAQKFLSKKGKKMTSKRNIASSGITRTKITLDEDGEAPDVKEEPYQVIIHTYYCTVDELTNYSVTSKFKNASGRIRFYRSGSPEGFRDANDYEYILYIQFVHQQLNEKMAAFDLHHYYGSILQDGHFRLHINDLEDIERRKTKAIDEEEEEEVDQRTLNRGRVCMWYTKMELLEAIIYEEIDLPEGTEPPEDLNNLTREQLIERIIQLENQYDKNRDLLNVKTDDQLRRIVMWVQSQFYQKRFICDSLQAHFVATNKMIMAKQ